MEEANHIQILAQGRCKDILQAMRAELKTVETVLVEAGLSVEELSYSSQQAFARMEGFVNEGAKVESRFIVADRRVSDAEGQPGVREILRKEEAMAACDSPQQVSRLKREVQHLRSLHGNKLSALSQHKQALLKERLELIKLWKNVLLIEINILDDSKAVIKRRIMEQTRELGDPDGEKIVQQMLDNLSVKETIAVDLKIDPGNIKVHNIHVLNEMLNEQLRNIQRIERAVQEKREVVESLNSIIKNIRDQLPADASTSAAQGNRGQAESTPSQTGAKSARDPASRMAYLKRFKR